MNHTIVCESDFVYLACTQFRYRCGFRAIFVEYPWYTRFIATLKARLRVYTMKLFFFIVLRSIDPITLVIKRIGTGIIVSFVCPLV